MMNKLKSRSNLKLGKYSLSCCSGGIQKIMKQEASHDHGKERFSTANTIIDSHDEIKWEVRPGGMLVQKRSVMISDTTSSAASSSSNIDQKMINIRISTFSHDHHHSHHISLLPTSTFGEVKVMMSVMTGLETREQRVLFRGKEREDGEYLHMVGVGDNDKLLLLQDPAFKARKQLVRQGPTLIPATTPRRTISV